MKVLIAGTAGLVGRHFALSLAAEHEVTALKRTDLDISDRQAVERCVAELRPALIINCAVLQVDESERDTARARAVNAEGAGFLAGAAQAAAADLVHLSTQYVFQGEPVGRPPYTIEDEPLPVNVYGRTKLAGERAVGEACERSYIIRTSWVFGSGKATFLCNVHRELAAGRAVRAIDDIWSSTTHVEDLIDRIRLIVAQRRYGVYHIVNPGVCSYYDFALEAGRLQRIERTRLNELIEVTHERAMERLAARPRYTPMRCLLSEKLGLPPMRDWREALAEYVRGELG